MRQPTAAPIGICVTCVDVVVSVLVVSGFSLLALPPPNPANAPKPKFDSGLAIGIARRTPYAKPDPAPAPVCAPSPPLNWKRPGAGVHDAAAAYTAPPDPPPRLNAPTMPGMVHTFWSTGTFGIWAPAQPAKTIRAVPTIRTVQRIRQSARGRALGFLSKHVSYIAATSRGVSSSRRQASCADPQMVEG